MNHPRTVLLLIAGVQVAIITSVRLPHFPEDFQPPMPQTAQRVGVAFPLFPLGLIPKVFVLRIVTSSAARVTVAMRFSELSYKLVVTSA